MMVAANTDKPVRTDDPQQWFDDDYALPGSAHVINDLYLADEATCVRALLEIAAQADADTRSVQSKAASLVERVRQQNDARSGLDAFLQKYDLSSQEGIMLMCIAEALLRIPDADTADRLIADKLSMANWSAHVGTSDSMFVNASTWGLMLTGKMLSLDDQVLGNPISMFDKLVGRLGEPVVRAAMRSAMRIMGHQFVMGRDIKAAIKRSRKSDNRQYRYSFDMLGEAALTRPDAARYFEAYADAIDKIGSANDIEDMFAAPSISVKLSALYPRYEFARRREVLAELAPQVLALVQKARDAGIAITMDAEEADRLELSLDIFEAVITDPSLGDYQGFGLAVQAYQKRAVAVVRWLAELSSRSRKRIPVRLVKGAYWDTEIKHGQELGYAGYPVFTRKVNTDVSYLACARLMLEAGDKIYPQFATHNAHTIAYVMQHAGGRDDYEFQRLHGMGEDLYSNIIDPERYGKQCRVYAPVGSHEDLLPYLVRRLLENGANTSFVNRIVDEKEPIADIVADPIAEVLALDPIPHPRIHLPAQLFGDQRLNSKGINLADRNVAKDLAEKMRQAAEKSYEVAPIVGGQRKSGTVIDSVSPHDQRLVVGTVAFADAALTTEAIDVACEHWRTWDLTPAAARADVLDKAADLFEVHTPELLALCVREAGKSIPDAIAELREAVDFLRYYAAEARARFAAPIALPGPTGESNLFGLRGRGVFVCVSPWNFPLAIFTGQVAAALAAGNAVIAKPAEQTSIVASRAVELMLEAGIPKEVLHFLPGTGLEVGATATADVRVAGVAFTGSTATALSINRSLAARDGQIGILIAETGGQNAMIVDSSALPEQVVLDAVQSGFNSAGQRCSALRVLCVQEEVAPRVIELLKGAMVELHVGDSSDLANDVGPVIDQAARDRLDKHVETMREAQTVLYQCELPESTNNGIYYPPTLIEIDSLDALTDEVFGPIVHVYRFKAKALPAVVDAINNTGFGLTFGVHTRIDGRAGRLAGASLAGNVYINRNMVGAVVGSQPFGGRGLSGTGPKAGGPNYLTRFASEYTVSNNTAAVGGNASLLSLDDD
ncbi:MAG: bifunctional proline dehydrogenase/L-glutamate gamma-semialdehyde dehydrogenase PutA [Pseudomonadota bacterium]